MQAVIVAAGRGTRLQPITPYYSKAMVPILGVPMVERVMDRLAVAGVSEFILVVNPADEAIQTHFRRQSRLTARVCVACQPSPLGMANALSHAAPLIRDNFALSACDILVPDQDIGHLLALWRETPNLNGLLTVMPVERERLSGGGAVELDGFWVTRIVEKSISDQMTCDIASVPLYCFTPRILNYLDVLSPSIRGEYELQDAIQMLIDQSGQVGSLKIKQCLALTSTADLLSIVRHHLAQNREQWPDLATSNTRDDSCLIPPYHIDRSAHIGTACTIGPFVAIERECYVGNGATIQNALLMPGAVVADGQIVTDQVVG